MPRLVILIIVFSLSACGYKNLQVKANSSDYNDVISQSIRIDTGKEILSIVCFTEIKSNVIQGLSCQNDTGFHLFSGGIKTKENGQKQFEIEKMSSFIFKIKPKLILSYIKLALFDEYELLDNNVEVNKKNTKTLIMDNKNKLKVVLDVLK